MIINATLGNGFSGALQYIHKMGKELKEDKRSEVIERNNLVGSNPKLLAYQMREQANRSGYSKKPVLHLSFNFATADNLTRQKEVECVIASMKHLGISEENHQYVIVKHNDSNHSHYHAIINKVSNKNKIIDTNWIKNKCVVTADKIEQDFKLSRTANRTIVFAENEQGYKYVPKEERTKSITVKQTKDFRDKEVKLCEYKTIIRDGIVEVLADQSVQTVEQLKNKLAIKSINTRFTLDENTNKIKGTAFNFENKLAVKGSEVGYSANIILEKLEQNKELTNAQIETKKVERVAEPKKEIVQKPKKKTPTEMRFERILNNVNLQSKNETEIKEEQENQILADNKQIHLQARALALESIRNEHNFEFRKGNLTPNTQNIYIKYGFINDEKTNNYIYKHSGLKSTVSSQIYEDHKINLQIKRNQNAKAETERVMQLKKEQELKEYVLRKLAEQSAKKDIPPIETKPQQTQPIKPKKEPIKPQQNVNKGRGFKM
jgi:hypothetical protein